jgi:hypothetical protein
MEFKTASYANLLADSEPYETRPPTNGRRDFQSSNVLDNACFWAQNEHKLSFLKRSSETITNPRLNESIKTAIDIAETTVVSPGRGSFARYYLDGANGVWAAKGPKDEPVQVYNLKGHIVRIDNPRYNNPRVRDKVNEYDSWQATTAKYQGTHLGNLDTQGWIASRLFSLDLEITSEKQKLSPSSRVAPSKGTALTANILNPLAAEFVPSVLSSPDAGSKLSAAAKEFFPSSPASTTSNLSADAPEFVPSSPARSFKLRRDAPEFVPSPPTGTTKLNVNAPESVPHH